MTEALSSVEASAGVSKSTDSDLSSGLARDGWTAPGNMAAGLNPNGDFWWREMRKVI